jgi:hypothetical protein
MTYALITRRRAGAAGLAALLAAVVGCASAPDVRQDQDPSVDLRAYKTFSFVEFEADRSASYADLIAARLKAATRTQMERQRYVYAEAQPDLLVRPYLVVRERQELRSSAYGRVARRGWSTADIETVDYRQGTIVVDLIDRRRGTLVWHGVAEGRLDAHAMEQPNQAIESALAELFARFGDASRL